jgi:excisionase family DNA binding protein
MKRVIVTEFTETELQQLIEQSVRNVLSQELQKLGNTVLSATPFSETYLTRKQVKNLIGISYPTISKLTKSGTLKGKALGGVYRYKESDIRKYFSDTRGSK